MVIHSRYIMNSSAGIWVNFIIFRVSYRKLNIEWKHKYFCKISSFSLPSHSPPPGKWTTTPFIQWARVCGHTCMPVVRTVIVFSWRRLRSLKWQTLLPVSQPFPGKVKNKSHWKNKLALVIWENCFIPGTASCSRNLFTICVDFKNFPS